MKITLFPFVLLAAIVPLGCAKKTAPASDSPVSNAPAGVAPVAASQSAPAKATLTSKEYGFALYLPSKPKLQQEPLPKEAGGGTIDVYTDNSGPVGYVLSPLKVSNKDPVTDYKKYYDEIEATDSEPGADKSTLISSRDLIDKGLPYRDIVSSYTIPGENSAPATKMISEVRLYLVGDRFISFAAVAPERDRATNKAQIEKVFNSIVFDKQGAVSR